MGQEKELKIIITVTVTLSIIGWAAYVMLIGKDATIISGFRGFSACLTALTFFWFFFFKYGWQLPLLSRIFNRPNLNGTWIGRYESLTDGVGKDTISGPIVLVLRQSFIYLNVTSLTEKSIMHSYAETLIYNNESQTKKAAYLYMQSKISFAGEDIRQGAAELQLTGESSRYLSGPFWTNAKTKGFIKVKHISKDHSFSFEECVTRWPNQFSHKEV